MEGKHLNLYAFVFDAHDLILFRIRVFSFKSLKPLAVLSYHRESIYSIGFAENVDDNVDHWLIGASKDTRISMWSLY